MNVRKCPICSAEVKCLVHGSWQLPSIEKSEIGFSICPECGMIIQSPSVHETVMNRYYECIATYINPGREGKPAQTKVRDVERLINLVRQNKLMPEKVFQVGCSDGYTLSCFKKAGSKYVKGIDPSSASHDLALEMYGIDTYVGCVESYLCDDNNYDLIILTHVLEHLYDPVCVLKKCLEMMNSNGMLLIEVPLFERPDRFPPGYLSFEHLNYFTEKTLSLMLFAVNCVPVVIEKLYYNNEYPVIAILAKMDKNVKGEVLINDDPEKILIDYIDSDLSVWRKIEERVKERIKAKSNVYIYGAGIHTTQLLANTSLRDYLNVRALIDTSPTKWGIRFGDLLCYKFEDVELVSGDVILISSYASENEIYDTLMAKNLSRIKIEKIYNSEVK